MSWPVPSGASASLPVVPLPWTAKESRRPQIIIVPNNKCRRSRKESVRKAKYGIAMIAGLAVVSFARKVINSVPILNLVTRPVLDLFPTIIVGPALGAAVMYGIEKGDLLAARHVVREKAQRVRQELDVIVQDLSSEIQVVGSEASRQMAQTASALDGVARAVTDSVAELERTMLPATEREYRRLEAQVRRTVQNVAGDDVRSWASRPGNDH